MSESKILETLRLSIGQSELDMKIDKLNNLNNNSGKSEKNINSI